MRAWLLYGMAMYVPLSLLLHEYGHALAASVVGMPWFELVAGPWRHRPRRGVRLRRWPVLSETGWVKYAHVPAWPKVAAVVAAGPLAHLLLAGLGVAALAFGAPSRGLGALAVATVVFATSWLIYNLLPLGATHLRLDLGQSDGSLLLHLLRERYVPFDAADQIMLDMERRVPLRRSGVPAAECGRMLQQADGGDGGWRMLLACWHAFETGELERGADLLEQASMHEPLSDGIRGELAALSAAVAGLVQGSPTLAQDYLRTARAHVEPEDLALHEAMLVWLSGQPQTARRARDLAVRRLRKQAVSARAGRDWIRVGLTRALGPEPPAASLG